ncbi:MAG: hypothetical protein ACREP9_22720 [Candidatus Dormibacteraceae bacterium]
MDKVTRPGTMRAIGTHDATSFGPASIAEDNHYFSGWEYASAQQIVKWLSH